MRKLDSSNLNQNILMKRLTLWDNFFEKTREKFLENSQAGATTDASDEEGFIEDDPLFEAAEEEHRKVKESLVSELGISEESADIGSGTELPNSKYSKTVLKRQPSFHKKQKKCVKRDLKKYGSVSELSNHSKSSSCAKDSQVESDVKNQSKPDYSTERVYSRDEYQEYFKHYELWQEYKRIKENRYKSSIYIVSCLNEEPSEANRYVPDLPSVVKKPKLVPPRFSLRYH